MANPSFSVVIPLYQQRPYIRRSVESVLSQGYEPFELIIVDDGSTDGGFMMFPDIVYGPAIGIYQRNQGVAAARNTGMRTAKHDWIAFLDADDMWLPGHLEELARIATAHPDAGLIATSFAMAHTDTVPTVAPAEGQIRRISYFDEASENIGVICTATAAVRRDVFETIGGFGNFPSGEDLEYWARIALNYPVAMSSRVTSVYFRGTGGVMESAERQARG